MTRKLTKRSVVINGHRTSLSLDDRTYSLLKHIAASEDKPLYGIIGEVEIGLKVGGNLSGALRFFAVNWALGNVRGGEGEFLRKLLKDGGGTEEGFLLNAMNWALNKSGVVLEVSRGTV